MDVPECRKDWRMMRKRYRLTRLGLYLTGPIMAFTIFSAAMPLKVMAMTRTLVEMGDPDDSNDKPTSGPGIRTHNVQYAAAVPMTRSSGRAKGGVAQTLSLLIANLRIFIR
jgi:hypothetical protein